MVTSPLMESEVFHHLATVDAADYQSAVDLVFADTLPGWTCKILIAYGFVQAIWPDDLCHDFKAATPP